MKRFWKQADVAERPGGYGIALDGRPVKTPARADLVVPTAALAEAIAAEWNSCAETVDPGAMPMTGLSNAAVDRIASDLAGFAKGLAAYADNDLLCYRAERPNKLVVQQAEQWDPLLEWASSHYRVEFRITQGLIHVDQPEATVNRLKQAVESLDGFTLAGLSPLVTIGGSLVAALAVHQQAADRDAVWTAVSLDERWQAEQWGHDDEAAEALAARRRDFLAGARFLDLIR